MLNIEQSSSIEVPRTSVNSVRRAVMIADDSVNKTIAQGHFAIYEPVNDMDTISSGKFLVIRRRNDALEELSVRRVLSAVDGDIRLTAHSTNAAFKEVLAIDLDDLGALEVLGVVVGKYAPL